MIILLIIKEKLKQGPKYNFLINIRITQIFGVIFTYVTKFFYNEIFNTISNFFDMVSIFFGIDNFISNIHGHI